jgi:hypothetical protein
MKESSVNGKLKKYWGKRKEKASKNKFETTTESTVEDTKENKASAFNKVSSLMGRDLLPLTIAKLRTCKEITNFCLINKQSSGMCKGDIFHLLKTILMYKGKKFNYDGMIQEMLSKVIEMTSSSSAGDYAKGIGMYQDCCRNEQDVLIKIAKSMSQGKK